MIRGLLFLKRYVTYPSSKGFVVWVSEKRGRRVDCEGNHSRDRNVRIRVPGLCDGFSSGGNRQILPRLQQDGGR
jgi:hypothetical protein